MAAAGMKKIPFSLVMAIKVLLVVTIMAYPMAGYLLILAGIIDFSRVRNFKRPIFCISPAEFSFQDGRTGTYAGFIYSFELKEDVMPENELFRVTEYTARILNTPVMSGVRE